MSKITDSQNRTYGSIAAIQTIANTYPKLNKAAKYMEAFNTKSPIQFLLNILNILGITETDLVAWLTNLLCDEYTKNGEPTKNGLLIPIEYAIKTILFLNIKDLFLGCTIDPFIPEYLIEETDMDSSIGIKVPVSAIDMFGVLTKCPVNDNESIYYFDNKPNIFNKNYLPSSTKYSTDFNAFLWHVIHKSDSSGDVWDNRNFKKNILLYDTENSTHEYGWGVVATEFFSNDGMSITNTPTDKVKYKPIIRCRYINTNAIKEDGSLLKITLPACTYRYKKNNEFNFNRTIFEFNYDFIFGLKLFDTKVLVANIINSLIGLSSEINVELDFKRNLVRNTVENVIENLLNVDSEDLKKLCATSFSNDDYNNMLSKSTSLLETGYSGPNSKKQLSTTDINNITSKIQLLNYSETVSQGFIDTLNEARKIVIQQEDVTVNYEVKVGTQFDITFIRKFIEELVIEIVMQTLSPKVMILYYINTHLMGDITNVGEWEKALSKETFDNFLKGLQNLIISSTKQIIDKIIKELLNFLLEKITPILKIFAMELLLETIRDYKDLIVQIITTCGVSVLSFTQGIEQLSITDVDYADIVPELEIPNNDC